MVRAELSYNPYLMETDISFNGQPPHINSLVEKYQDGKLQDWIKELPRIFHDEMNGFGFELEFSGTQRDFKELKRAFRQAGVSEEQVILFHKSELEERDIKRQRIKDLLKWLENNPNNNYDNDQFRTDNEILFDGAYSVIVIQRDNAQQPIIDWAPVSVEVIRSVFELDNTDLTYTPIIINLGGNMINELQETLRYLHDRQDVAVQQVFFILGDGLNKEFISRMIIDLGIKNPHFIKDYNDEQLVKYFELYPVTEFIIDSIKMFEDKIREIETVIENERMEGEQTNTETARLIKKKDSILFRLRSADETISAKNYIDKPTGFTTASIALIGQLKGWRKKKTKTVRVEEAQALSEELYLEMGRAYKEFITSIKDTLAEVKTSIDEEYKTAYESSGMEDNFTAGQLERLEIPTIILPKFDSELMNLQVKEKMSGKGFFSISSADSDDVEMQTAFYMQQWREHVFSIIAPIIETLISNCMETLSEYNMRVADGYHEHLQQLIEDKTKEEESLVKQLSTEELKLQQDGNWLIDFSQQLKAIERR